MLVAVQYGAIGVAATIAIVSAIMLLPLMWLAHHIAGLSLGPTLSVIRPSGLCAVAMGVASAGAGMAVGEVWDGAWMPVLIAKVCTGVLVYGILALVFIRPWPLPRLERYRQLVLARLHLATGQI
jgi:hypothetical protein